MTNYQFIKPKIVAHSEIVVCLFDYCNLRCTFCPQDHQSMIGASREEILAKVATINNWINFQSTSPVVKIHLMGGELFQDTLIERGFLDIYDELISQVKEGVKPGRKIIFNFITNLVFKKTTEVKAFLKKNQLKLSVSYDSAGRFNHYQRNLFSENIKVFSSEIELVSCVMTRENMHALTHGDELFDELYQQFTCDWDHFLPSVTNSQQMMPSESETFAFYKLLVDRYPECLNVRNFVEAGESHKMTCTRGNSLTIMRDGSIPAGCSGSIFLKDPMTKDLGSEKIVENFLTKYNCFECQFYKRCPFTCFIKNDYKHTVRDMEKCVFKSVFEYVEEKN